MNTGIRNEIHILDSHVEVIVTQRNGEKHVIKLDHEDYEILQVCQFGVRKPSNSKNCYAFIHLGSKYYYIHRFIMKAPKHMHVHHLAESEDEYSGLDCRRNLLQLLTPKEHASLHGQKRAEKKRQESQEAPAWN